VGVSRQQHPVGHEPIESLFPPRTPGVLGVNDAADPSTLACFGDTPGPIGVLDGAAPTLLACYPKDWPGSESTDTPISPISESFADKTSLTVTSDESQDAAIEALDLSDKAKKAAYALKKAHPSVVFTSGRRNKEDQARAMASNVVKNRKWIEQTYKKTEAREACQKWVDDNPTAKTQAEIQAGLLSVLNGLTDDQLRRLSKHLSGDAFDVQPVEKGGDEIKETIRALAGPGNFLEKEGGLIRWHAQF
jgi:hypothetical protein